MRNYLYIIGLSTAIISCSSRPAKPQPAPSPTAAAKPVAKPAPAPKPMITKDFGVEFFKTNIAGKRGDNTISHGSIVSAEPQDFKVVKTHFPAVAQNYRQRFIVLHYTALDDSTSIRVLTQQAVSSHYLVNELDNKEIYQLVDENKRAYHAGISSWRGAQGLNDTSIGIEIVNKAADAPGGGYIFPPFPDYQVKKVAALVRDIAQRYDIPPFNIVAHSDIAPTRKQDPGPMFPWKRLYDEYQIGMWYDEATKERFLGLNEPEKFIVEQNTPTFIYQFQTMLRDFGYGIVPNGLVDDATKKTVTAFQYHFRPQQYDGVMDAETFAILQALLQKYPK